MIRRYAILPLLVPASVTHARATPLDNLSASGQRPAAVARWRSRNRRQN